MEKNKTDASKLTDSIQEAETNELLNNKDEQSKEDHGVNLDKKNPKTDSPSHDDVPNQFPPILQWPYANMAQLVFKQYQSNPRPLFPSQQSPAIALNQSQTSSFNSQQPNPIINHLQQNTPAPHLTHSSGGFWLPPGSGFSVGGTTAQPFIRNGTSDTNWQTCFSSGGASARNDPHNPSFFYQGGYSNPMGFPGTWNPYAWWGQSQQLQPPYSYTFPGAYGGFPFSASPVPISSQASGHMHERGIIQPQEKISRKHQQMWEAQSAENIQMWAAIGQLQAEVGTYGSRLMKLEAEISSLKSTVVKLSAGTDPGTAPVGQTLKRGRSKKYVSVDVLPSPDESQPRTHGRKTVPSNAQPETRGLSSEKECLDMEKERAYQPAHVTSTGQQEKNVNTSNFFTYSSSVSEHNRSNPNMSLDVQATSTFNSQVHQNIYGTHMGQFNLNPSSGTKGNDDRLKERKTAFSVLSELVKGANTGSNSTTYNGTATNGNHGWAPNIPSNDCGRNLYNTRSQAFYSSVNLTRPAGKPIPGWSFTNEDASEEHVDVVVGSSKDDDGEEMEDTSSKADEMIRVIADDAYEVDPASVRSPKVLARLNRW